MQKHKITWVGEKKDVQTKFGLKQKFSIKVEGNDNFISVWVNATTANWKVGQEIECEIKSREYNGKTYYDAEIPKQAQNSGQLTELITRVNQLDTAVRKGNNYLEKIFRHMAGIEKIDTTSNGSSMPDFDPKDINYPTDEPNIPDISQIPF